MCARPGGGPGGGEHLCCEHLRVLVAMHSGLAFLSLHCFTYKMGTVAFTVGLGGCSETWVQCFPQADGHLAECLPLTVCV